MNIKVLIEKDGELLETINDIPIIPMVGDTITIDHLTHPVVLVKHRLIRYKYNSIREIILIVE